jgi:hypothetical protein
MRRLRYEAHVATGDTTAAARYYAAQAFGLASKVSRRCENKRWVCSD